MLPSGDSRLEMCSAIELSYEMLMMRMRLPMVTAVMWMLEESCTTTDP